MKIIRKRHLPEIRLVDEIRWESMAADYQYITGIYGGKVLNIQLIYEPPTAQDYVNLRLRSGMGKKDLKRSQTALENSLFTV